MASPWRRRNHASTPKLNSAGSSDVIELHGNIHRVICLDCGTAHTRRSVQDLLEHANPELAASDAAALPDGDADLETAALADFHVPPCPVCGGMLQPDVVFFGDGVPRARSEAAERAVVAADAVLVVGSSLVVFSTSGMVVVTRCGCVIRPACGSCLFRACRRAGYYAIQKGK